MLYFRRTMVMSEEGKEEEPRRDAAISTNCDMYMFPPSSLPCSHLQQASAHVVIGWENQRMLFPSSLWCDRTVS